MTSQSVKDNNINSAGELLEKAQLEDCSEATSIGHAKKAELLSYVPTKQKGNKNNGRYRTIHLKLFCNPPGLVHLEMLKQVEEDTQSCQSGSVVSHHSTPFWWEAGRCIQTENERSGGAAQRNVQHLQRGKKNGEEWSRKRGETKRRKGMQRAQELQRANGVTVLLSATVGRPSC